MFWQFSCPWYLVILQFYYHNVLLSMVRELFEFYDLGLVVIDLNANDFAHCKLKLWNRSCSTIFHKVEKLTRAWFLMWQNLNNYVTTYHMIFSKLFWGFNLTFSPQTPNRYPSLLLLTKSHECFKTVWWTDWPQTHEWTMYTDINLHLKSSGTHRQNITLELVLTELSWHSGKKWLTRCCWD